MTTGWTLEEAANYLKMGKSRELVGHNDVRITLIYIHVLNRGGKGEKSSVDSL